MIETILLTHSILIYMFLGFLVGGLFMPMMTTKNPQVLKKISMIYTFIFQAIITMIAFAGLVAFVVGEYSMNMAIVLMIVIWAVMMYIEIRKHKLVKVANLGNPTTYKLIRGLFIKIGFVQILLVAVMVVLMVLRVKGVISL
ncbi:hypothetical protein PGH07_08785 [Sulfurovum sp. zt1-1]|uniref:Copper resistance protein D n=1 Tax=Sulfurovum zhangzhouensis TaxID=3019067 RepID=A0ABT7QZL6_9BACT|nr:hypothetical protein [Sulfurovum zhangzhouensis]MDM5272275.1 hypothetical protein [Sulfurovum zhangzhouensis]